MCSAVIKKEAEGIIYNSVFESFLKKHCLFDYNLIMQIKGDGVVKNAVKERTTLSLTLDNNRGKLKIYLKKYDLSFLKSFFSKNAVEEFRTICGFHCEGLPTMTPVCSGKKRVWFSGEKSFLVTKSLDGVERLDRILSENILTKERKQEIILKTARIIKKMHGCGFVHKDLYLCHLLIDENYNIFIVDLHRVERFKKLSLRYLIKDMAALNYSSDEIKIKSTYKLKFLKEYFSNTKLSINMKKFIKKVVRKTEKMKKHNRKKTR